VNDSQPASSFSARKNPQRIPANTPPDFRACGLASGRTSFASSRMATSDRFRAQNQAVRSIDIGIVRFCERLLHHDLPTDEEVRQAGEWVAGETKPAVADMDNYQAMTFVSTALASRQSWRRRLSRPVW
jgi:hypothetical protein